MALYHSTIRWFEACSRKPTSTGLPPSQLQHAMIFSRSLLLGTRMNSCRTGYNSAAIIGFLIFLQYSNHLCCWAIIYAGMLGTGGIN